MVHFPRNITELEEDSGLDDDDEDEFTQKTTEFNASEHVDLGGSEDMAFRRKLSSVHSKIITEDDITTVRNKFYEDIESAYEDAIARKHVSLRYTMKIVRNV
jgi:hypothetical protein